MSGMSVSQISRHNKYDKTGNYSVGDSHSDSDRDSDSDCDSDCDSDRDSVAEGRVQFQVLNVYYSAD